MITADRRCANGGRCIAYAALGEPAKLSRYNEDDICSACNERRLDDVVVPNEPVRPRRTPHGTGPKPYLRPDGRWCARYFDKDGRRRSVYARSRETAQVKLVAALAERDGRDA
jgi:hypothetical protein